MPARAGTSGLRLCSGRCQARAAGTQHRPPGAPPQKAAVFAKLLLFASRLFVLYHICFFSSHLFVFVTSVRFVS